MQPPAIFLHSAGIFPSCWQGWFKDVSPEWLLSLHSSAPLNEYSSVVTVLHSRHSNHRVVARISAMLSAASKALFTLVVRIGHFLLLTYVNAECLTNQSMGRILDCLCNGYTLLYTVRVKSTSPVDIYWNAIFVILYNIIALHHNANVFSIEIK